MELYSEYNGTGGRTATVTRIKQHMDPRWDLWEVALYINKKVVQRSTLQNEPDAQTLAESFCQGGDGNTILLNEIING